MAELSAKKRCEAGCASERCIARSSSGCRVHCRLECITGNQPGEIGRAKNISASGGIGVVARRNDIPVEAKTEIVAKLGEVAGPMVKRFLQDYLATFSERDRSPLRRAVEETARRIPDDPNAGTRLPSGPGVPAGGAAVEGGDQ